MILRQDRWKPAQGETFFFIDSEDFVVESTQFYDSFLSKTLYDSGNCFRSHEEAESIAAQFRAIIAQHHGRHVVTEEVFKYRTEKKHA